MKKIIIFMFLLLIFPMASDALEGTTIENMNVHIIINDLNKYSYEEEIDTRVIYGENLDTYYYERKIPKTFTVSDNNKKYNININNIYVYNDYKYDIDLDKNDYTKVTIGEFGILTDENNHYNILYDAEYNNDNYNFILVSADYDIENLSFEVVLPDNINYNKIYYSLNGKDYYNNLNNLYSYIEDNNLFGTYKNKIKAGDIIYIKIADTNATTNLNIWYIIISVLVIVTLFFVITNRKNIKKRIKNIRK